MVGENFKSQSPQKLFLATPLFLVMARHCRCDRLRLTAPVASQMISFVSGKNGIVHAAKTIFLSLLNMSTYVSAS